MMFLGREEEQKELKNCMTIPGSSVLIYGKRRVGKTSLILEVAKDFDGIVIYYECLKTSLTDNLERISAVVKDVTKNEFISFKDYIELFRFLGKLEQEVLIIIDEYPYLKNLASSGEVDSIFQNILDNLSQNIHIILSGSYISVMKELMEEDNPLFGRFSLTLNLQNMDYRSSALFYPKASLEDKVKNYCIFGGNPYANANLNLTKSLKENIITLLLKQTGILRVYMESVLLAELGKTNNANRILLSLANGKKKYSELEEMGLFPQNGLLDKNLKVLLNMELIEKTFPINAPNDKKKTFYSIRDNLVRFYYSFVMGNEHYLEVLGEDVFFKKFIEPGLWQFISLRYEDMVKEYFSAKVKRGELDDVLDIGRFWYDDPVKKKSGEFDLAIRHFNNSYSVFEVKCYKDKVSKSVYDTEKKQFSEMTSIINASFREFGMVSLHGFDFNDETLTLLDGTMLYDNP